MDRSAVPALTRAMRIVDLLAEEGQPGLGVSDIAARTGIAKSTTALLCSVLEEEGMLRRHENRYRLGRRFLSLAGDYLASVDPIADFYEEVRRVPIISRHSARLALLDGTDVLYLARYEVGHSRRLTGSVGDRFPASVTATGKAMLSTLPTSAVEDRYRSYSFPRYTPESIQTLPDLLSNLEACRARGYAMDDEETNLGQVAWAIPVGADASGQSNLAISATMSKDVARRVAVEDVLAELRQVAEVFHNPLAGQTY